MVACRSICEWRGIDDLGHCGEQSDNLLGSSLGLAQWCCESWSRENVTELGEQRRARDDVQVPVRTCWEKLVRRAVPEEPRDRDVGIKDDPHAGGALFAML